MNAALRMTLVALGSAALGAGALALYNARHPAAPAAQPVPAAEAAKPARKALYWHDPMVPGQRFDKPGKSPFMDMELVPVYADEAAAGTVAIDPRLAQNIGVRYAQVQRLSEAPQIAAVGSVRLDETRTLSLQARVGGFIERQAVRATNQPVSRGQVLAEITSPELVQAQEELLLATRLDDAALIDAATSRLALLGVGMTQAGQIARSGRVQRSVAIVAPAAGIVTEIAARPGMNVAAGAPLFTLSALDTVWVVAELPERDAAGIAVGREAQVGFAALPGETFKGKIEFIYPDVAASTRTASVRIVLANPQGRLRPGMLANVRFAAGPAREALWVPSEALIQTGSRNVVIVAEEGSRFRAVDVVTGVERDGRSEIRSGLAAGQKIVASGQFMIDSEASLKGALARMDRQQPAPGAAPAAALAEGKVESIDRAGSTLTLNHGPIPSVDMPGMTMRFRVEPPALLDDLAAGAQVEFDVVKREEEFVVTVLKPKPAAAMAAPHRH
jgi:Cu(I)/Ag(I) efflux system membrane fusion protein